MEGRILQILCKESWNDSKKINFCQSAWLSAVTPENITSVAGIYVPL